MSGWLGLKPGTASVAKGYRYRSKPDENVGYRYDQSIFWIAGTDCWDVFLEGLLVSGLSLPIETSWVSLSTSMSIVTLLQSLNRWIAGSLA